MVRNLGAVGHSGGAHGCAYPEGGYRTWNSGPAQNRQNMAVATDIPPQHAQRGKHSSDWLLGKVGLSGPL